MNSDTDPKLSVIIPCYNLGQYVNQAVQSVLNQSFRDFEIIIVDDGSQDFETITVLDKISHPKIHLLRTKNQGLVTARNTGISKAKGVYICCLDADDYIENTYLEKSAFILDRDKEEKIGFVTSWAQLFEGENRIWKTSEYDPVGLAMNNIVSVASVFRKKAWEEVGGYNINMKEGYEDWNFWISIVAYGYKWEVIQEPLFFYRVRNNSMITKSRLKHANLYGQLMKNNRKFFHQHIAEILGLIEKKRTKKKSTKYFDLFVYGFRDLRSNGLKSFFFRTLNYLKNRKSISDTKLSIENWYNRKKRENSRQSYVKCLDYDPKQVTIVYIVPGTNISGGVAVVLQHANRLIERGYDVKILSQDRKSSLDWFPNQKALIIPFCEEFLFLLGEIDILVATSWTTAPFLETLSAKRKIYFVQSDERRFSPEDIHSVEIIDETYRIDCEYMTEAKWIQGWLEKEYSHNAYYVPNGLDTEMFHKTEPLQPKGKKPRVLIEGSINVLFKGMDDAYSAIKDLDVEIWIVSNNGTPKPGWRYDKFFENVSINEMKNIYSSCDIFLKMSRIEGFFGPPMEAMACGCAVVVGKVTGYDEYIVDGYNALVVEQSDVEGAKKAVERLMNDDNLRKRFIENAHQTAKEWNWNHSIDLLEKVISGDNPEKYYSADSHP